MLRTANPSTGALPFQSLMVADLGDVSVNLYNLQDSCRLIREAYQKIVAAGCIPLTLGNGASGDKCSSLRSELVDSDSFRASHGEHGDSREEGIFTFSPWGEDIKIFGGV